MDKNDVVETVTQEKDRRDQGRLIGRASFVTMLGSFFFGIGAGSYFIEIFENEVFLDYYGVVSMFIGVLLFFISTMIFRKTG